MTTIKALRGLPRPLFCACCRTLIAPMSIVLLMTGVLATAFSPLASASPVAEPAARSLSLATAQSDVAAELDPGARQAGAEAGWQARMQQELIRREYHATPAAAAPLRDALAAGLPGSDELAGVLEDECCNRPTGRMIYAPIISTTASPCCRAPVAGPSGC